MNLINGVFALSLLCSNVSTLGLNNTFTSSSTEVASIENTNVSYDLNLFSNDGKYDYTYDWTTENKVQFDEYGKPSNSDYSNFKFLVVKPVLGDVYVYFYWKTPTAYIPDSFSDCVVGLSMATDQNEDGSYIEDVVDYSATLVNTYGTHDVWFKYKISDVYDVESNTSYRIYVDSLKFDYRYHGIDGSSDNYFCGNSIIFQTNEDGDLVYDYWRKDYVTIDSGKVASYLVAKDLVAKGGNTSVGSSYNEYTYYFFNTDDDHPITDLISVTYNYYLLTYDVNYSWDTGDSEIGTYYFCYDGLYNSSVDSIEHKLAVTPVSNQSLDFDVVSDEFKSNQVTYSDTTSVEVDRPYLTWFPIFGEEKVSYNFDSIQDLNEIDSISDEDSYSGFKSFMYKNYLDDDGNSYDWAFQVDYGDLYRSILDYGINESYYFWNNEFWNGYNRNLYIESQCHEVEQALITHLTYYNDNDYYSLDVLDTPKDTISISVENVQYDGIADLFFDISSGWSDLFSGLSTSFYLIFGVFGVLILLFILSKIIKFINLFKKKKK